MGSQFFGLVILILAVAAGVYVSTNYTDLINLRIQVPVTVRPVSIPPTGLKSQPAAAPISNGILSPVPADKIARITSIRQPNSFNNYLEVIISSSLNRNETANITGWTVKSNKGSFAVPRAQETYSFSGPETDITLRYDDSAHLYSGRGPIGNFRVNKCLGYVEDVTPLTPALSRSCPAISRSEISGFSGSCQNYLTSLRACQNPAANPPVPLDDFACHDFLRKLSYVGCVEKYGDDSDFLQNEWRAWLEEQIKIFDPTHDKIQLLDKNGKLIDEYLY